MRRSSLLLVLALAAILCSQAFLWRASGSATLPDPSRPVTGAPDNANAARPDATPPRPPPPPPATDDVEREAEIAEEDDTPGPVTFACSDDGAPQQSTLCPFGRRVVANVFQGRRELAPREAHELAAMSRYAVVYLANWRSSNMSLQGVECPRMLLLMHSLELLQRNVPKARHPILIFHDDYAPEDFPKVAEAAPELTLFFVKIDLRLMNPPNTTLEQAKRWVKGLDGGIKGRTVGYRWMCRFFSGAMQATVSTLFPRATYYLRLDDDSFIESQLDVDPLSAAEQKNRSYVYRSLSVDQWGGSQFVDLFRRFIEDNYPELMPRLQTPNANIVTRSFSVPYNNYHISRLSFWQSKLIRSMLYTADQAHSFMKYRWGDATIHGIVILILPPSEVEQVSYFAYRHNYHYHSKGSAFWGFNAADLSWSPCHHKRGQS
eukprot:m51a1_g5523 hypothetical protein (433) ;mRNA; r:422764-424240